MIYTVVYNRPIIRKVGGCCIFTCETKIISIETNDKNKFVSNALEAVGVNPEWVAHILEGEPKYYLGN